MRSLPCTLAAAALLACVSSTLAAPFYITSFTKTNNAQAALQTSFPTGLFTPSNNPFNTSYDITADVNNHNFAEITGSPLSITGLNISNVGAVNFLIASYSPPGGATLSHITVSGASNSITVPLVAGTDIRDFYFGNFANTIDNTTTQLAYEIQNVQGGGGTGNSSTGAIGTYHFDQYHLLLPAAFTNGSDTVQSITITRDGSGTPIVLGITADSVPEPASLSLLAVGSSLLLTRRRPR